MTFEEGFCTIAHVGKLMLIKAQLDKHYTRDAMLS